MLVMSDYSEQGAVPIEDAAIDDPPTEAEVRERQQREFPEQAETATWRPLNSGDGSADEPEGG